MKRKNKLHIATYQRVVYRGVPVAEHLSRDLPEFSKSVVIRLGGSMPYENYQIHINSMEAVKNSIDKLKQKHLLLYAGLPALPTLEKPEYPVVVKAIVRSGGLSVFIANNEAEFKEAVNKINGAYILEPLFNATSEYRLHCTKKEVFFAVKKHKRNPADIIINRDNHFNKREFLKPRLWKEIQAVCIKAMTVLGLDIACFDVIYNSVGEHSFVICEANTNPELLHNTYMAYLEQLKGLIEDKIKLYKDNVFVKLERKKQKLTADQTVAVMNKIIAGDYEITDDGAILGIEL